MARENLLLRMAQPTNQHPIPEQQRTATHSGIWNLSYHVYTSSLITTQQTSNSWIPSQYHITKQYSLLRVNYFFETQFSSGFQNRMPSHADVVTIQSTK